jgi:Rrf2 family iron-sulfur cluster assembly transcriptional regulator
MISKTGLHAALAIRMLATLQPGQFAGTAEIARSTGAPRNYLGKLLQMLADEGIVESQKGYGGGFRLARNPGKITLFDIVEPIDHVSRWNGCFLGNDSCSDKKPCAVHYNWKKVRDEYLGFLKNTSVTDIME